MGRQERLKIPLPFIQFRLESLTGSPPCTRPHAALSEALKQPRRTAPSQSRAEQHWGWFSLDEYHVVLTPCLSLSLGLPPSLSMILALFIGHLTATSPFPRLLASDLPGLRSPWASPVFVPPTTSLASGCFRLLHPAQWPHPHLSVRQEWPPPIPSLCHALRLQTLKRSLCRNVLMWVTASGLGVLIVQQFLLNEKGPT